MAGSGTSDNIKLHSLFLEILEKREEGYLIKISKSGKTTHIIFDPVKKILFFLDENSLTNFLRLHEYQFRKILHNKQLETFYPGFTLNFVIWENKNMLDFNNNKKIITFDHTTDDIKCYVNEDIKPEKYLYVDGSYLENIGSGAIAIIIKNSENDKTGIIHAEKIRKAENSNRVELIAAIKALEMSKDSKVVRLHTDSRYVKKGITEWIFYWLVNDWTTANGTKAKHIDLWKYFLELTNGKIIQFKWIKGHSDENPENKLCDYYAKMIARNKD
jgi:ribonuclease HI